MEARRIDIRYAYHNGPFLHAPGRSRAAGPGPAKLSSLAVDDIKNRNKVGRQMVCLSGNAFDIHGIVADLQACSGRMADSVETGTYTDRVRQAATSQKNSTSYLPMMPPVLRRRHSICATQKLPGHRLAITGLV